MNTTIDSYLDEVENLFYENKYERAKEILENLLYEEPGYGKIHNYLGWVYMAKLDQVNRAKLHFDYALKFSPDYAPTYFNLSLLYISLGLYEENIENLNRALEIADIDKSAVYNELGRVYELKGNLGKALSYYKKALTITLEDEDLDVIKENIKRVKTKKRALLTLW